MPGVGGLVLLSEPCLAALTIFFCYPHGSNKPTRNGRRPRRRVPVLLRLAVNRTLTALFTFLDDPYVIFQLQKVEKVHDATRDELWTHARIRLHDGKTKLWNRRVLQSRASVEVRQSTPIISTRLNDSRKSRGHPELVHAQLEAKKSEHQILLERILQTCYLSDSCSCFARLFEATSTCATSILIGQSSVPRTTTRAPYCRSILRQRHVQVTASPPHSLSHRDLDLSATQQSQTLWSDLLVQVIHVCTIVGEGRF